MNKSKEDSLKKYKKVLNKINNKTIKGNYSSHSPVENKEPDLFD